MVDLKKLTRILSRVLRFVFCEELMTSLWAGEGNKESWLLLGEMASRVISGQREINDPCVDYLSIFVDAMIIVQLSQNLSKLHGVIVRFETKDPRYSYSLGPCHHAKTNKFS